VITGGHRAIAHENGRMIVDLLFDGHAFAEFATGWIDSPNTHGTGCAFASALAAYLARGDALPEAVEKAQRFVAGAIRAGITIGRTGGAHGPLHHFWGGILDV
jgi:hydroxymethylpyrimidine/phosphomethylpyrimidine kinase